MIRFLYFVATLKLGIHFFMMMSSLTHVNSACGYMFHIPPNGYCTHTDIGHHQVIGHQTLTPGLRIAFFTRALHAV